MSSVAHEVSLAEAGFQSSSAKRRRIKTVMQELIYRTRRIIVSGRRFIGSRSPLRLIF
jgi:hypothetical protein